jgi:hypothetical protein
LFEKDGVLIEDLVECHRNIYIYPIDRGLTS